MPCASAKAAIRWSIEAGATPQSTVQDGARGFLCAFQEPLERRSGATRCAYSRAPRCIGVEGYKRNGARGRRFFRRLGRVQLQRSVAVRSCEPDETLIAGSGGIRGPTDTVIWPPAGTAMIGPPVAPACGATATVKVPVPPVAKDLTELSSSSTRDRPTGRDARRRQHERRRRIRGAEHIARGRRSQQRTACRIGAHRERQVREARAVGRDREATAALQHRCAADADRAREIGGDRVRRRAAEDGRTSRRPRCCSAWCRDR